MGDIGVDFSLLPQDVKDKIAELDLELSEGKFSKKFVLFTFSANIWSFRKVVGLRYTIIKNDKITQPTNYFWSLIKHFG